MQSGRTIMSGYSQLMLVSTACMYTNIFSTLTRDAIYSLYVMHVI